MFWHLRHHLSQAVWILALAGTFEVACAQETLEATWRSGFSRWNGTSYEHLPKEDAAASSSIDLNPKDSPHSSGSPHSAVPTVDEGLGAKKQLTPYRDLSANVLDVGSVEVQISDDRISGLNPSEGKLEPNTSTVVSPPVTQSEPSASEDPSAVSVTEVVQQEGSRGWRSRLGSFWSPSASTFEWLQSWDSQAELGLDGSSGNAETLGVHTGFESKRSTKYFDLELDVDYRQARNRNKTTEDNGRIASDFDRMFNGTSHSAFGKFGTEWDRFKAFDLRLSLNGGYGYHWIRRDDASLVTRFGAGASREIGAPNDDWVPEAVFGVESERKWSTRQKMKQKLQYFPAWEDFGNFRLVADLSWETTLDEADKLRLKWSMNNRYDSTPQGARRNDLYYSLLLLYKF